MADPDAPRDPAPDERAGAPSRGSHRRGPEGSPVLVLGLVVAVLLAAFVGVALTTDPAADDRQLTDVVDEGIQGCERGNWPREVFGRPQTLTENPAAGVYVWLDFEGWHVRAAGGTPVTGQVFVTGKSIVPLDAGGTAVDVLPNSLSFELDGTDATTGLDFSVGCDFHVITFDVRGERGAVPTGQIWVGQRSGATANPFIYQREAPQ